MAGYQKLSVLLLEELDQLEEEGKLFDRGEFEQRIKNAENDKESLMKIYSQLCSLPQKSGYPYTELSEYDEIQNLSKPNPQKMPLPNDSQLYEKIYGAWYGRCIGCALGQPVELWSAESIKTWCEKANAYPLDFYIPTHSRAETEDNIKLILTFSTSENIKYMQTDDDIRYTVSGLNMMKAYGFKWDSWDLGASWLSNLPFRQLCTAENQAYMNFINVDENGPWGKPDNAMELLRKNKVNTYLNPYREWIGAQIRVDSYGYVCAGDPHMAAKLAYTDAYFSHVKNGIYGAMFFAALIAAAVSETEINRAIDRALCEIPSASRFYEAMIKSLEIADNASGAEELIRNIITEFKRYNVVHTINNAALCLAAIRYSKGDFNTALSISVMGGMDTDCNGATVGSVMGAFVGINGIPDKWKTPLNDTLYSGLLDYHPIAISEIAKQTCDVHHKLYNTYSGD